MNLPRLSVILPNYNHARFLPGCLEALLKQSVQPLEIIVIDDASDKDNSAEIIQRFAKDHRHIRFISNETNQGVVYWMGRGLEEARGEYIYYAAADDQVLPGLFEKSLTLLAAHRGAALCCTIGDWHEEKSDFNWQVAVGMAESACYLSPERLIALERRDRLMIASHTAIMRKAAIQEAGGFRPDLRWHCDWFAIYVAAFRHGICYIPEPLARFNIHLDSYYKTRDPKLHREVLGRLLELLTNSDHKSEATLIREAGSLFLFGMPMLRLMLAHAEYRRFITPNFLRKNLWHSLKLEVKKITPRFAAEWYFRLAGYKARGAETNISRPAG